MIAFREPQHFAEPSVFSPQAMLREARRQKHLPDRQVPSVCILDPDGDLARALKAGGRAQPFSSWPCYHTEMLTVEIDGLALGIVPNAVGSAFAVLVAEQLFASGCELVVSITSAGRISENHGTPPYFFLIESAWRDEGTSAHYLPPGETCRIAPRLLGLLSEAFSTIGTPMQIGSTWTTDAPFRETPSAITWFRERGVAAVEMEAAALYAFAEARDKPLACFAHVTNSMAQNEGDFEKGHDNGAREAFELVRTVAATWHLATGRTLPGNQTPPA